MPTNRSSFHVPVAVLRNQPALAPLARLAAEALLKQAASQPGWHGWLRDPLDTLEAGKEGLGRRR